MNSQRNKTQRRLAAMFSAVMTFTPVFPLLNTSLPVHASEIWEVPSQPVDLPAGTWQREASFPDWAGVDNSLAMNSHIPFHGTKGQGTLYISVAEGVERFRLFVNNSEVDTSTMLAGQTWMADISALTIDGTNQIQVTAITPGSIEKAVTVRVGYPSIVDALPEEVGMSSQTLESLSDLIDSEVEYGYSAAQMAVIKDGKMVYSNAWGLTNSYRQNGEKILPEDEDAVEVTTDTLFDLASNTKMYSVNYALQYMLSNGGYDISLDDPITKFFPEFDDEGNTIFKEGTDETTQAQILAWKSSLTIRDILKHQAGFDPDPQYHNDQFNQLSQKPEAGKENPLFSQDRETTRAMVLASPLTYQPGTQTRYSDVDYMLLCFIIEQVTGQRLDEFLDRTFWTPMGLEHMTYNPLDHGFTKDDCAATELNGNTRDGVISFENVRTDTVQGEVHDEKAYYAMDGISGHAGLFSNAEDLARLANLMLTGGEGENRFFSPDVLDEFTKPKASDAATWGLGWWRNGEVGRYTYFTTYASESTIGHQGWTGTLTVIDPEENLVITLLTNKKNSPVLDPKVDANDFFADNMVLGGLGCGVGYVYEALNGTDESVDASLKAFADNRLKVMSSHKGAYDENAHMNDAFALSDALVKRAARRQTQRTVDNANAVLDQLEANVAAYVTGGYTGTGYNKDNVTNAAAWLEKQRAALAEVEVIDEEFDPVYAEFVPGEMQTALGQDQNALYWPQWAGTGATSRLYNTNVSWFQSYEGQGVINFQVNKPISEIEVFVNGQRVNTDALLNTTGTFTADVSFITKNGNNSIQVTTPYNQPRSSLLMTICNPEIIDETDNENAIAEAGIGQEAFDMIDSLARHDIENGFTSAQMAVIKDGKLIYSNAWGKKNTYAQDGTPLENAQDVTTDTLYDLASNTKMYATNYAVQYLVSKKKLDINQPITDFFPDFANNTIEIHYDTADGTGAPDLETAKAWKAKLCVKDILQHQAGFAPGPQYHNDHFNMVTQKPDPDSENPLYALGKEAVSEAICKTPLVYEPGTKTVYSDVDYMLLGLIVEQITGQDLNTFLDTVFWQPMGLEHVTFNPLENGFTKDDCAATELNGNTRDGKISFTGVRTDTIQGQVHDEKAWYGMDGVSGHAGLFANAEDLAKLASVMLNHSGYGNNRFFEYNVLDYFTSRKDTSASWGQGWWRNADLARPWYFSTASSRDTIGHQGWTGTLTAIDPEEHLVVVYLTNKINSPVTDKETNANKFDGNWYVSASLGHVNEILYQSLDSRQADIASDDGLDNLQVALDALLMEMSRDEKKLIASDDPDHASVKAWYSLVDACFEAGSKRPDEENKTALKAILASMDETRDAAKIKELKASYADLLDLPAAADKSLLASAIAYAQAAKEDENYDLVNDIVKEGLDKALENAEAVMADEEASQDDVNEAWLQLSEMIHMLGFTSDKAELSALVAQVEAMDLTKLEGDVDGLKTALANAKAVLDDPTALDERIAKAVKELKAALENVHPITINVATLSFLIEAGEKVSADDYLNDKGQVDAFMALLNEAKTVRDNPDSQKQVDDMTARLHSAYLDLRKKPSEEQLKALKDFLDRADTLMVLVEETELATPFKMLRSDVTKALDDAALDEETAAKLIGRIETMDEQIEALPKVDTPVDPSEKPANPTDKTDTPTNNGVKNPTSGRPSANVKTGAETYAGAAFAAAAASAGLFFGLFRRRNRK